MSRTIITVVGKDTVGIIAKVCNYLASNNINICDYVITLPAITSISVISRRLPCRVIST